MRRVFTAICCIALGAMAVNAEVISTPAKIKSGYNQDVICENQENVLTNTTQIDVKEAQGIDGSGAVYYTTGVQEEGALCGADGIFYSKLHTVKYQINPAGLNGLVLKAGKFEGGLADGTLEFENTMSGKSLYVVATSADGDTQLNVVVNYTDNTNTEQTITVRNWDTTSYAGEAAVTGLGRLYSKDFWAGVAGDIQGGYNFMLFESAINIDPDKQVKSVTVEKTNSGTCCCVFAVSINNETVENSGINDIVVADATPVEYYNINGQKLAEPAQGVNIVRYSNGKVSKMIVR
ncbi:MAG: hypothetical protein ACI4AH_03280 [Muribaculaceae bacterium]